MKTLIAFLTIVLTFLPVQLMAEESGHDSDHGEKTIKIQAWSFSDPGLEFLNVKKGDPCGEFLSILKSPVEKYQLLSTTGIQGPPGVVYTMQNHKGEIAILKCGTAGGCSHDDGGGGH